MIEAFASISQNIQKKGEELARTRRNIKSSGGFASSFMPSQRGALSPMSRPRDSILEKQQSPRPNEDADSSQFDEPDPTALTSNVLKLCNVIRAKHAKVSTLHRNSGRGGQGPHGGGIYGSSTYGNSNATPTQPSVLYKSATHALTGAKKQGFAAGGYQVGSPNSRYMRDVEVQDFDPTA